MLDVENVCFACWIYEIPAEKVAKFFNGLNKASQ